MHYNGSIPGVDHREKKKRNPKIIPMWKVTLSKLDILVYITISIWVIWLFVH